MDDDLPKKPRGVASMSLERHREVSTASGKTIHISAEEKALNRERALSLAAAFQSWARPRRTSE